MEKTHADSYGDIAKRYGLRTPEAAAGFASSLPANDPRVAQQSDVDLPEQIHVFYNSADQVTISW